MGIRTSNLLIRSQMLYPVELRAQKNRVFTYENTLQLQQQRVVLSREIPLLDFGRLHTDSDLQDRRLTFHVHSSSPRPRAARRALLYSFLTAVKLPERGRVAHCSQRTCCIANEPETFQTTLRRSNCAFGNAHDHCAMRPAGRHDTPAKRSSRRVCRDVRSQYGSTQQRRNEILA